MTLITHKIPIISGRNDIPSTNSDQFHPNGSFLSSKYNALIDQLIIDLANLQGIQGPQGPQGEQGLQGIPGPQGEQGPQGDSNLTAQIVNINLSNINQNEVSLLSVAVPKSFIIYQVVSSCNVRLRLYYSGIKRLADLLRASNEQIIGEHECFLDCLVNTTRILAPPPIALSENNLSFFSITNLSGIIQNTIDIQLKILKLEA